MSMENGSTCTRVLGKKCSPLSKNIHVVHCQLDNIVHYQKKIVHCQKNKSLIIKQLNEEQHDEKFCYNCH